MKSRKIKAVALLSVALMILALLLILLTGCASSVPIKEKPGAQLWGENCGHCHNIRPPNSLTDGEWSAVVTHMRTRANLSAVEAEKILEFLQQSN
ncbi:MAG: cytochrome c [Calditrichaeota bacterium]|nr:MAG: cytochrome c [Calditrichota bacterium]